MEKQENILYKKKKKKCLCCINIYDGLNQFYNKIYNAFIVLDTI